jgi:hypothetical protein
LVKFENQPLPILSRTDSLPEPEPDAVWGARNIAREIGTSERMAFYYLETGLIPGAKIGRRWFASRRRLRERLGMVEAAS